MICLGVFRSRCIYLPVLFTMISITIGIIVCLYLYNPNQNNSWKGRINMTKNNAK